MADTGATSPGTMADDATVGTKAWSNPDNAKANDDSFASTSYVGEGNPSDNEIKIVKNGSIGSENKSLGEGWGGYPPSSYSSYGANNDLWGETWTAEDINNANFGIVLSIKWNPTISHYLKATNFGFSIPSGATIDGIVVEIERSTDWAGGNYFLGYVDHIRITVYYTEAATGTNCQVNIGDAW